MQHIKLDLKTGLHLDRNLIGKYIYLHRFDKESSCHHIFKLTDIIESTYLTDRHYFFYIPNDKNCKAFCYDGVGQIDLCYKDKLFILDNEEYIDTFRMFVKYDSYNVHSLPDKIIQDKKES